LDARAQPNSWNLQDAINKTIYLVPLCVGKLLGWSEDLSTEYQFLFYGPTCSNGQVSGLVKVNTSIASTRCWMYS